MSLTAGTYLPTLHPNTSLCSLSPAYKALSASLLLFFSLTLPPCFSVSGCHWVCFLMHETNPHFYRGRMMESNNCQVLGGYLRAQSGPWVWCYKCKKKSASNFAAVSCLSGYVGAAVLPSNSWMKILLWVPKHVFRVAFIYSQYSPSIKEGASEDKAQERYKYNTCPCE